MIDRRRKSRSRASCASAATPSDRRGRLRASRRRMAAIRASPASPAANGAASQIIDASARPATTDQVNAARRCRPVIAGFCTTALPSRVPPRLREPDDDGGEGDEAEVNGGRSRREPHANRQLQRGAGHRAGKAPPAARAVRSARPARLSRARPASSGMEPGRRSPRYGRRQEQHAGGKRQADIEMMRDVHGPGAHGEPGSRRA